MECGLYGMSNRIVVCNGCCCGRVEKGHAKVPINALKAAWKEHGLERKVKLTISGCLGPCSMHNVSLLKTEEGLVWLGKLRGSNHYDALVRWASTIDENGVVPKLPEILERCRFHRLEDVVIKEQELYS